MKGAIAITGAAGFIGSNLAKYISSQTTNDIILVDDFSKFAKTYKYTLMGINPKLIVEPYEFIDKYQSLNIEQVYHIGAEANTKVEQVSEYFWNNYYYTLELIEKFEKHSLKTFYENPYFVFASSSAVYGNDGKTPLNVYGLTKLLVDHYIQKLYVNLGKRIVSFRFFNVYGPGEYHKGNMASMVYQLWSKLNAGEPMNLFEFGEQKRDYIYVDDVVENIWYYVNKDININSLQEPVIDLGTGKANDFNYMAQCVYNAFKENNPSFCQDQVIKYIPMPENIKKTYQVFTQADNEYGFKPTIKYDLKRGIEKYVSILSKTNIADMV